MFNRKATLALLIPLCFGTVCHAQNAKNNVVQPIEASIEEKLEGAVWRTDYYICTGIAYAKQNGKTVKDFTEFVGNLHSMGENLEDVVNVMYDVPKTYPNGEAEVLSKTDSLAVVKINRPWTIYFEDGLLLGVSLEEFESYLFGHLIIMGKKINLQLDFKYEGENNALIIIKKV